MYRGKYFSSIDAESAQAIEIRKRIPEFDCGSDEHDDMAVYAVVYNDEDVPSGSARLYIDDDSCFRIDYLGVLPEQRHKYMGDLLARMLLYRAQELNCASIKAAVPKDLVYFFARYGLKASSFGSPVVEMSAPAEGIRLEGSCSKSNKGACSGNCESCM